MCKRMGGKFGDNWEWSADSNTKTCLIGSSKYKYTNTNIKKAWDLHIFRVLISKQYISSSTVK